MAEISGFWTTSGTPSGHQVSGYTQTHHSKSLQIAAGAGKYEGVAVSFANELRATVTGANAISINSGGAIVDGKWYENTAAVAFTIPSSVSGTARIDRIVVRVTWASFTAVLTKIAGTDAASPTAPAITRNTESVYDLPICQVLVNSAGAVSITDERALNLSGLSLVVLGNNTALVVGDGKLYYPIPELLNGYTVLRGDISLQTASSSGSVTVQAALDGVDLFSTRPVCPATVDDSTDATGTRGIVAAEKILRTGMRLRVDIDGAGTGAKGLVLNLVLK